MDYEYCPRCGTRRDDAVFGWCKKCGFDFKYGPGPDPAAARQTPQSPSSRDEPRTRIDVRPVGDRRDIAKWTRDAFTVRCLGTFGGMVGAFLGFFLLTWIGAAMQLGVFSLVLGLFFGIPLGLFLGIRLALGLLAK